MTAAELIVELRKVPPDTLVYIHTYEFGGVEARALRHDIEFVKREDDDGNRRQEEVPVVYLEE